jgi:hypothetical protein
MTTVDGILFLGNNWHVLKTDAISSWRNVWNMPIGDIQRNQCNQQQTVCSIAVTTQSVMYTTTQNILT